MENCWKKYCVSFGSLVTTLIRFPSSWMNSMTCWSDAPPLSMAMGMKMFLSVMLIYLEVFKVAEWLATVPADWMYHQCAIERRCRWLWHPTQVPFLSTMKWVSLHQISCRDHERGRLAHSQRESELSKWCNSGVSVSDVWLNSFDKKDHANLSRLPLCHRGTYAAHKF